jgi:DNA-binding Lrp family transcriptional regulator
MPTTAYVLIEAAPKKAASACAKIAKVPGVKSAHMVTGPFDIIARIEGRDSASLGKLVLARIQNVDGVARTITCVCV